MGQENCSHKNKQYWWFWTDFIVAEENFAVHYWKCPDCGESQNVSKEEYKQNINLNTGK